MATSATDTVIEESFAALDNAVDVTLKHLDKTFEYDFSLKHPRLAYIVGANEYLKKMEEANLQDKIDRDDFENALGLILPSHSVDHTCAMTIKCHFLLSSITNDEDLYNTYWAEQYEVRGLANPDPDAEQAFFCLEATLFETRSALARYRARQLVAESKIVVEVDACIKQYNRGLFTGVIPVLKGDEKDVGVDARVWATDDEEGDEADGVRGLIEDPIVAAANAKDGPRRAKVRKDSGGGGHLGETRGRPMALQ